MSKTDFDVLEEVLNDSPEAPPNKRAWRALTCLIILVMTALIVGLTSGPVSAHERPSYPFIGPGPMGKPAVYIQYSRSDTRKIARTAATGGVQTVVATMCGGVKAPPYSWILKGACVLGVYTYFESFKRTFARAARRGNCVRLRFGIPATLPNGWWETRCQSR